MPGIPVATVRVRARVRTRERGPGLRSPRGLLRRGLAGALVVAVLGTAGLAVAPLLGPATLRPSVVAGGPPVAAEALTAAAAELATATAPGGTGYRFTVVQTATLRQRGGGEPIPVVDPADPRTVTGTAPEAYVTAMVSAGAVSPDGFWMEMRRGPKPGERPDFAKSPVVFTVVDDGRTVRRNDGQGFYEGPSPGMGFDPATAAALPGLLERLAAQELTDLGTAELDGTTLHGVAGTAAREDYPGAVAADGLAFTETTFPVEAWFDAEGRLVRLVARARNLNQDTWDLVLETALAFEAGPAGARPAALPAFDAAAAPAAPDPLVASEVAP
jgi:hypothetical protein